VLVVQLTVCPDDAVQFHTPLPPGVTLVTVRFVGTGSVIVTAAVVGPAFAALLTVSVNVPVPFSATVAVAGVFASVSNGGTVTVAVAGVGVGPPPPVELTVFVYGDPVPDDAVYPTTIPG
jgi:hypothetical protein